MGRVTEKEMLQIVLVNVLSSGEGSSICSRNIYQLRPKKSNIPNPADHILPTGGAEKKRTVFHLLDHLFQKTNS